MIKVGMTIKGSGWVYLNKSGDIEKIKEHKILKDAILLIDCWEHAYVNDYQGDREGYLRNIWRVLDWRVIEKRI